MGNPSNSRKASRLKLIDQLRLLDGGCNGVVLTVLRISVQQHCDQFMTAKQGHRKGEWGIYHKLAIHAVDRTQKGFYFLMCCY